jgi:hypothetical protein
VKESVTARDAAEQYGLKLTRNGMTCCIFHPDKHPSMKVNQDYYYCFSCGAHGDVIALTAQLLGVDALAAAKRLAEDFSIPYEEWKLEKPVKPATPPPKDEKVRRVEQRLDKWLHHAEGVLLRYRNLLEDWQETYRPKPEDKTWHPLFCEAQEKLALVDYWLDILIYEDDTAHLDFFGAAGKG